MFNSKWPYKLIFISLIVISGVSGAQADPSADREIVGGDIVSDLNSFEYKHTVRLLGSAKLTGAQIPQEMQGLKMTWRCSGALIKANIVLSAGHCFPRTLAVTLPASGKAVRGELIDLQAEAYFKKDSRSDRPWGVRAQRILVHEGFSEEWMTSVDDPWNPTEPIADLAILSLTENASADKESVELLRNAEQPLAENEAVTLAGYGRDVSDGQISIPKLRRVEVPYRESLRNQTEWFVGSGDLARAGKVGQPRGACMGDSGGPLFVKRDGKAKLAGIIIRGPSTENGGCEASVTIVTAVPSYEAWIEDQMSQLTLARAAN